MEWRNQFFAKQLDKKGLGLEIGPSHSPIASKSDGYNVHIVDHADQSGLIKKYSKLNIDTSKIESVDFVWNGNQTLSELIKLPKKFDYVIASHVIEHTTDIIAFIQDCERLLKPAGRLCLAIPDKRYCFDYFRPVSSIGDSIEAFRNKNVRHTPGKVFDYLINAAQRKSDSAWNSTNTSKISYVYDFKHAKKRYQDSVENREYIDIHNWMFTPNSFRLLLADLQSLNFTKLSYVDELDTQGFEFFAVLSAKAEAIKTPRIDLAKSMMEDQKVMLQIDEAPLRERISELTIRLQGVEQELISIKQSKRWRYLKKPAKLAASVRGRLSP